MALMDNHEPNWPRHWPIRALEVWRVSEMVKAGEDIPKGTEERMTELGRQQALLEMREKGAGGA